MRDMAKAFLYIRSSNEAGFTERKEPVADINQIYEICSSLPEQELIDRFEVTNGKKRISFTFNSLSVAE